MAQNVQSKGFASFPELREAVVRVVEPSSPVNIVASAIAFFLTILLEG
jgi:hypothetical protein